MSTEPGLRSRANGREKLAENPQDEAPPFVSSTRPPPRLSFLDVLRMLGGLALLSTILSYFITGAYFWTNERPLWTRPSYLRAQLLGDLLLTPSQLSLYNGTDPTLPIYLALNSTIYDVSASPHFYGPGGGYHTFAGRDATRAFVTGCFAEDTTDDLRGVEEIYMPLDLDEAPISLPGESAEAKRKQRGEWKRKREQARRRAVGLVEKAVKGWEASFGGGEDKYKRGKKTKYWRVGRLVYNEEEERWRRERPIRELCQRGRNMRPKTFESLGLGGEGK